LETHHPDLVTFLWLWLFCFGTAAAVYKKKYKRGGDLGGCRHIFPTPIHCIWKGTLIHANKLFLFMYYCLGNTVQYM
jgi:hypothetical protein